MTHEFFSSKRPWSRQKDFILEYYLEPYISKVAKVGKPVLIVDCFAGRGRFGDGAPGSPAIIGALVEKWRAKRKDVSAEFIEADPLNFEALRSVVKEFGAGIVARCGTFEEIVPELARRAKRNSVFLYVDPYTVKGLVFDRMRAVYDQIHQSSASVELLLNLNVATFMRWALAAVKRHEGRSPDSLDSEADYQADDPTECPELATLDAIAGGDYWRVIAEDASLPFASRLERFSHGYRQRLASSFKYVASCEVKERFAHQVPKYLLVFGTRHPDGLELMNEAMCKARRRAVEREFVRDRLFDMTPEDEAENPEAVAAKVLAVLNDRGTLTRHELRVEAIRRDFGRYTCKDFNRAVDALVKSSRVFTSTGKPRINDHVQIGLQPFR